VLGVVISLSGINAIKVLLVAAILNGIVSVPIMVVLMIMVADPAVMGTFVARRRLKTLGWLATGVMAAAVLAMFALM
jgi:Mn2+/Fe2+ NRAMP family transporter